MGREFDSRQLRNLFFSSVRAGDNTNGYDSEPLDTSSVWRGEAPGDQCFKVDEIPRTRKHRSKRTNYEVDENRTRDPSFDGHTALPIRPLSQR